MAAGISGGVGPGQAAGGPGGHMSGVDLGPSPLKRPKPDLTQPLHVDVEIKRVGWWGGYSANIVHPVALTQFHL